MSNHPVSRSTLDPSSDSESESLSFSLQNGYRNDEIPCQNKSTLSENPPSSDHQPLAYCYDLHVNPQPLVIDHPPTLYAEEIHANSPLFSGEISCGFGVWDFIHDDFGEGNILKGTCNDNYTSCEMDSLITNERFELALPLNVEVVNIPAAEEHRRLIDVRA